MNIFIGSTNPIKIQAVIDATRAQWPGVVIEGIAVPSGIHEQPMSDTETRTGARNRAQAVLEAGLQKLQQNQATEQPPVVLGIGLEGGVESRDGELWSTVWAVVVDQSGEYYESNGARFKVPEVFAQKIREGGEMGPVVSALTGIENIKHSLGMIGVITSSFCTRTEEYTAIAKLALGLWYGRKWQEQVL